MGNAPAGIAVALLAGVVLLAEAAPCDGALPSDLKLDRVAAAKVRIEGSPNPHAALPCTRCHVGSEPSYAIAHRFGIQIPLDTRGESVILLCERCHERLHPQHPSNFQVAAKRLPAGSGAVLPLETPLDGIDKVTCTTCHDVHLPHTANRLLRGFAIDGRLERGAFRTREEFCRACHGEGVRDLSAHFKAEGDGGCGLCHGERDIAGRIGGLKPSLSATCAFCHPGDPGVPPHYYTYNPFPDFNRDELAAYGLELQDGRFTCATCHVHHRAAPETPYLRPAYIEIVAKSIRVNPHQTTRFCLNCHPVSPPPPGTPGAVAPLLEEEVSRLCNGCHAREGSLRMFHPLHVARDGGARIPEDWPRRKDGSLGCQTCHLAGHAPPDPKNPRFLRGAPFTRRNEPCFRCHAEGNFAGRNLHSEVRNGKGCDFCHEMLERNALRPEGKAGPILAEPSLLCLPCHSPLPHPASAVHTVRPGDYSFLAIEPTAAPLYHGKVTCHSCHDSHAGEEAVMLLRESRRGQVCTNCHPF